MTPIDYFAVSDPSFGVYNRGTDTLVDTLIATARITGSLVARQIDLTGIPDGEYDLISELPTPGSLVLRISSGIPWVGLIWSDLDDSSPKETVILTVKDDEGNIIAGADVYITNDLAGQDPEAEGLVSNSLGKVYIHLVPGVYYVWASHPNRTFTNPTQITVQDA